MTYQVGQIVEGKVTGLQPYGAFVSLDKNTAGLIHISEISDGYVRDISNFVRVGDTVRVKIIDFDANTNQARLSLKALHHTRTRYRRKPMSHRVSLPPMKIGFASIAEAMPIWIQEAQNKEKKNDEV